MEFARTRVLIKLLRVRDSTGRPPDSDWRPSPTPANQETRRQSSGDCFYGGDLTEGMIRTKPGTIHTYIYIIYRDAVLQKAGLGWPSAEKPEAPQQPRPWPRPLHLLRPRR